MLRAAICRDTRAYVIALGFTLGTAACSESSEPDGSNDATGGTAGSDAGASGEAGTNAGKGGTNASGGASAGSAGTQTNGAGGSGGTSGASLGGSTGDSGGANGGSSEAGAANAGSGGSDAGSAGSGASAGSAGSGDTAPSSGCGAESAMSGRFSIDVDGTERQYILKLPDTYDSARPYPLIFGWHGRMYDAEWVANGEAPLTGPYFGMESEAAGRAIFVAPQALETGWTDQDGRDLAFALAMVERFKSELCIDESRIYSSGFSFGAIMTLVLGCSAGDVFRAIGPMSGSLSNGCPASDRPVAYWSSHGLQDTTITPAQGEAARNEFLARNHCDSTSTPSEPEGCVTYDGCDPGYPVTFCTFEGAHVPAPFAGSALWDFFSGF